MKHMFKAVTSACCQTALVAFSVIALTAIGQAQLIRQATYNDGTFDELVNIEAPGKQREGCGMVESGTNPDTAALMIVDSPSLSGGKAARHQVKGCSERAETTIYDTSNVLNSSTSRTYWYKWNYYVPSNWGNWGSIVGQWPAYPLKDSNLIDRSDGRRGLPCSGAGTDFRIDGANNKWEFTFQHSNGSTGSVRSVCEEIELGSLQRGTWTTFVMQVKWTGNSDGFVKIWQNNVLEVNKTNVRTYWNDEDQEPYWKIGYYTGDPTDDGSVRILYTDESKIYGANSTLNDVCPTCEGATPPPATTVINEQFSSSPAPFTVVSGGTWSVTSGQYRLTSPKSTGQLTGNENISVHNTSVSGDYTLTADASVLGTASSFNDFSIIFNYQNATNYYFASFNETNDGNANGFFKVVNGTTTQIADFTSTITAGTTYAIKVVKTGSTYKIDRGTTLLATATDSSFSSGKVGFGSRNDACNFDNLKVTNP